MNILKMVMDMVEVFNNKTESYLKECAEKAGMSYDEYRSIFNKRYEVEMGKKYLKVWYSQNESSKSIVMFIDEQGNILKPESYKRPAKGIRGHMTDWCKSVNMSDKCHLFSVK